MGVTAEASRPRPRHLLSRIPSAARGKKPGGRLATFSLSPSLACARVLLLLLLVPSLPLPLDTRQAKALDIISLKKMKARESSVSGNKLCCPRPVGWHIPQLLIRSLFPQGDLGSNQNSRRQKVCLLFLPTGGASGNECRKCTTYDEDHTTSKASGNCTGCSVSTFQMILVRFLSTAFWCQLL